MRSHNELAVYDMPVLFPSKDRAAQPSAGAPPPLCEFALLRRPRSCRLPQDCPAATHTRARSDAGHGLAARLTCALPSSPCAQSRQANGDTLLEDPARRQPLRDLSSPRATSSSCAPSAPRRSRAPTSSSRATSTSASSVSAPPPSSPSPQAAAEAAQWISCRLHPQAQPISRWRAGMAG